MTTIDEARDAYRAKKVHTSRRKWTPIIHDPQRDPLDVLREQRELFTLADFQDATNLGKYHAAGVLGRLIKEGRVLWTDWPGKYRVAPLPCRALVLWTQAAPQFARNYIRSYVLEQFAPEEFTPAPVAPVCPF